MLIDTGAVVAIADPNDAQASTARLCAERIAAKRVPIYITLPTVIEAHRLILFRRGRTEGRQLLDSLYDGSLNTIPIGPQEEAAARAILSGYDWLDLSMADAINMAAMKKVGIRTVFSFDSDFLQAGFLRVPPFHEWW